MGSESSEFRNYCPFVVSLHLFEMWMAYDFLWIYLAGVRSFCGDNVHRALFQDFGKVFIMDINREFAMLHIFGKL